MGCRSSNLFILFTLPTADRRNIRVFARFRRFRSCRPAFGDLLDSVYNDGNVVNKYYINHIMQQNLTKLHEQFHQKHLELSQITQKIDTFMQLFKPRLQTKKNVRERLKNLHDGLKNVKDEFQVIKDDLITYGQLPNQFIRMVVDLPGVYEGFWGRRVGELGRMVERGQEENQGLRQKLADRDQQIQQLKLRLVLKEKQIQYQKIKQATKQTHSNFESRHDSKESGINEGSKMAQKEEKEEEEDLDQYINNMEITIKQSDEPLFKKITEQESQEEEEQSSNFSDRNACKNNTARSNLVLDCSDQALKAEPIRKASQCSFLQQNKYSSINSNKNLPKTYELVNKCTFWNKLSKSISSKTNSKKSLSQSKENIENRQLNKTNKFSIAEKKILTSKITDFRKLLFVEKGIQRLGFKVDNFI